MNPCRAARERVGTKLQRILHFAHGSRAEACVLMRRIADNLELPCPGLKQQLLRDAPAVDNVLLRTLGKIRAQALESGFQSISITELDWHMSNEGTWDRSFLRQQGYDIGKRAWNTLQSNKFRERKSRREFEKSRPESRLEIPLLNLSI